MDIVKSFLRKVFCPHAQDAQGSLVDAFRSVDYDRTRTVYGVYVCAVCGKRYTKEADRRDVEVQKFLDKRGE